MKVSGIRFYFVKWVSDTYFFGVEGFYGKGCFVFG
jgi:hypothetical protein